MKRGKTAKTALSFSNLVPPKKLTAATITPSVISTYSTSVEERDVPQMDHPKAAAQTGTRTHKTLTKTATSAARSNGKIQYPSTHKLWKKDLPPPRVR